MLTRLHSLRKRADVYGPTIDDMCNVYGSTWPKGWYLTCRARNCVWCALPPNGCCAYVPDKDSKVRQPAIKRAGL